MSDLVERDAFIESYARESGIEERAVALPCNCGEGDCGGWAMIAPAQVRWHLFQCTDAEVANPTRLHDAAEGRALARAFLSGEREFN